MAQRKQLHVTSIKMLKQCGERFRRVYYEGERRVRVKQTIGIAVDNAVTQDLGFKIASGDLYGKDDEVYLADIARDTVMSNFEEHEILFTQAEEKKDGLLVRGEAIDRAVALALLHHQVIAPTINPTDVQFPFSIELDAMLESHGLDMSLDLVGTIDVRENGVIRDTKTSIDEPSLDVAHDSQQLTAYALALLVLEDEMPQSVELDYLITKRGEHTTKVLRSERDLDDIALLMRDIVRAAGVIQREEFTPNPNRMSCNMCEFRKDCKFAKKK